MDEQLAAYREEQRRKHHSVVDAQGSTVPSAPVVNEQPPQPLYPQLSTSRSSSPPPTTGSTPSANLYPNLSTTSTSRNMPSSPHDSSVEKVRQYEEDERIARMIQEQEENVRQRQLQEQHQQAHPSAPPMEDNSSQVSDDEELAQRLQEEEEAAWRSEHPIAPETRSIPAGSVPQTTQPAPQTTRPEQQPAQPEEPAQQEGWMATIGRGIRNVYDMYQQYSQQQQEQLQRQQQQQQEQQHQRMQIDEDEALARRLQQEEAGTARQGPLFQVNSPSANRRGNFPNFYNYDEMYDDDEDMFASNPHLQQPPISRLREVNSMFRSMGASPESALLQHLQEMMRSAGPQGGGSGVRIVFGGPNGMSAQRYRFPRPVFQHVRGVETLPPELINMMEGESDTSYESLLQLADRLQPVSRGASTEQIEQLPTKTYTEGSMPADQKSCGVCLSDYESGEQLRTLPGCFHSFHKDCIDKWLQINKVCPVCRHEITETEEPAN